MGFFEDILFGKDKQSSEQFEEFEGTERTKTAGQQRQRQSTTGQTTAKQAGTTRALDRGSEEVLQQLIQQSGRMSGRPNLRTMKSLDQTDQLVGQLIERASKSGNGLDVGAIMAAAEARTRNALQAETTRLAEAGGSSLNTLVSSFKTRAAGERAIELGALKAELLSKANQDKLSTITAAIEGSGASTELRNSVMTQARMLPTSLAVQLASVLKGATTTTRERSTEENRTLADIIASFQQRGTSKKTGTTDASADNENQSKPGLFDFLGF